MLRRKPSPATIIACVALFVALGGTAIAARHYLITSTSQIKPSVLLKLKGKTGQNGAAGPAGLQGAIGPQGTQGPSGPAGTSPDLSSYAQAGHGALTTGLDGDPETSEGIILDLGYIRVDARLCTSATTKTGVAVTNASGGNVELFASNSQETGTRVELTDNLENGRAGLMTSNSFISRFDFLARLADGHEVSIQVWATTFSLAPDHCRFIAFAEKN
jgi:hypothetical protein